MQMTFKDFFHIQPMSGFVNYLYLRTVREYLSLHNTSIQWQNMCIAVWFSTVFAICVKCIFILISATRSSHLEQSFLKNLIID